jgi:hypothetical protein
MFIGSSTLSMGMLKKVDDGDDEVDDEMRTTVPSYSRTMQQQHRVLRNLSSGLSIYGSPLISAERCGGQETDGRCDTYRRSQLGS